MNNPKRYRIVRKLSPLVKKILPKSWFEKLKKHFKKGVSYKASERIPYEKGHYENGINYFGHLKANIGLGQGSRLYGLSLFKSEIPSCFINVPLPNSIKQEDNFYGIELSKEPKYSINLFHINPENFFALEMLFEQDILDYRYNIGTFLWELDHIPSSWIPYLDLFDEFWVPSKFIKDCLREVTTKPIYVIPYGMERINVKELPRAFDFRDKFTFLSMFDSKSNIERKNPIAVIKSFKNAFEHYPYVRLVVKTNNLTKEDNAILTNEIKGYKNIELLQGNLSREELFSLIKASKCLVSLHRAEGFGLPLAEAMSLNVPVIATDYSSTRDFVNSKSAYVVKYSLVKSNVSYQNESNFFWADPDIEDASKQMLNVFNGYKLEEKLKNSKEIIKNYLSIKNSSSLMEDRYKQII